MITNGAWNDDDFRLETPNLFSYTNNSVTYQAIGIGNKDGDYYILNRVNGSLLQVIPVGTSESEAINPDGGIIGLAAETNTTNPEIFIPSYYDLNASVQGIVYAYYPSNGISPWQFNSVGIVDGSVTAVPGAVLFGDTAGMVYAVDAANGNVLFQTQFNALVDGGITSV